jgi:hypothetical protein
VVVGAARMTPAVGNSSPDFRDLTIADLAYLLVEAEWARDTYRKLLSLALSQLHDANEKIRLRREQYESLADEYRTLRETCIGDAV